MNYVVTQVAKPRMNKVPQMQDSSVKNVEDAMDVYVKNAIVALVSVKIHTPEVICILNCNFEVPSDLKNVAEKAGIKIHMVPFGKYKSKEEFSWGITQYKFDSMDYVLQLMDDGDCMLLLDTDTVCTQDLTEIFKEAQSSLILYVVNHGYLQERRQDIIENYRKIYNLDQANVIHYGGEFFAGNKQYMEKLLYYCDAVIQAAHKTNDLKPWDDEHILSIAIKHFWNESVYPASPYIFRYWTNQFYLVSTNYYYDPVKIWHLPAEKNYGMIALYEYFEKNHEFPSIKKMASMIGLPGTNYKRWNPYKWKMRIRNKLKKEEKRH